MSENLTPLSAVPDCSVAAEGVRPLRSGACKCGEPHDGWPGNDGGEVCQMCWEAECSESWWAMLGATQPHTAITAQTESTADEGLSINGIGGHQK
jgi:hypothetical protein